MKKACLIGPLVVAISLAPNSSSGAPKESFFYAISARSIETLLQTTRIEYHHTRIDELGCRLVGTKDTLVPCGWDRYLCKNIPLGVDPPEHFPTPLSLFNYTNADPFFTVIDLGGHAHYSIDHTEFIDEGDGCEVGPHGDHFTIALHHTDWADSLFSVRYSYRVDSVDTHPVTQFAIDTDAGAGILDATELLGLSPPIKHIDTFRPDDGTLGSGTKACNMQDISDINNEPICLKSSDNPTYTVIVSNPHVVASMFNTCDIAAGPTSGDKLCASLNNIGITIPPIAIFDIRGEGINQDGMPVGRLGNDVCMSPTVFSFDPSGATTSWVRWLAPAGNPATGQSIGSGVSAPNQQLCDKTFAGGLNHVMLQASDNNGVRTATHPLLASKGPVGLIHGYLSSPERAWDESAPLFQSDGWDVFRANLKDRLTFGAFLSYPVASSGEDRLYDAKPYDRVLARDIRTMASSFELFKIEIPLATEIMQFFTTVIPAGKDLFTAFNLSLMKVPLTPVVSVCSTPSSNPSCSHFQLTGQFSLSEKFILSGQLFLDFDLTISKGTSFSDLPTLEAHVPLKISDDINIGEMGMVSKLVIQGESGKMMMMPYLRFNSPFFGLQLANGNLDAYDQDIKTFVESTLQKSGFDHMSIVAHSMGAVLTHAFTNNTPIRGQVKKVVLLAGPHRGSDTAFALPRGLKLLVGGLIGGLSTFLGVGAFATQAVVLFIDSFIDSFFGEAGRMLTPHSTYLQSLNRNYSGNSDFDTLRPSDALANDIDIHSYIGQNYIGGLVGPTLCHRHISLPFGNPLYSLPNIDDFVVPWICDGDMVVPTDSARLRRGQENFVDGGCGRHTNITSPCDKMVDRVLENLNDAPPVQPLPPATPPQGLLSYETVSDGILLNPGQGLSLPIHVDNAMISGLVVANSSDRVDLTVATPAGLTLNPVPTGSSEDASVALPAPTPGDYLASVRLPSNATGPAQVFLSGHFKTDAFLGLRAAGPTATQAGTERVPGEDILISAAFLKGSAPPSHGWVTCTVRDTSGSERGLALFDDGRHLDGQLGDGFHAGTIPAAWVTDPGNYKVTCGAIGTFGGEVIERHAYLSINVRYPSDFGIVDGSLSVAPAAIEAGKQVTLAFAAFNHTPRAVDFLTVEASERLADGRERLIGCFSFSPLSGNSTMPGTITWAPAEEGCRDVSVTITGITSEAEMSNSPQIVEPRADNRRTIRVCVSPAVIPLVVDAGGPYNYQLGSGRIVLDGSGSTGDTADTQYLWTLTDNTTRLTDVIATATGKHALVELPPGKISADIELTLVDPKRGSATAWTTLKYVDSLYLDASGAPQAFQDRTAPVAILDIPATAKVGEPVTFHSLSTDNFGTPPVQLFRIHGVEANEIDGFGRAMTTVFRRPGSYQVDLLVQDNAGFKSRDTKTIVVSKPSPAIASIVMPQQLESGREITAWVTLTGLAQAAGQSVQLKLGSQGNGSSSSDFLVSASNVAQTDACGIARVPVVPRSRTLGPMDVAIEVLGTSTCDLATGACSGGVSVSNPNGRPAFIDQTPPLIMLRSPAPGTDQFDACEPLRVAFLVVDEGSGVNPSSIRVTLDSALLPYTGNCTTSECVATVDTAGLKPGPHTLLLTAQDNLGNKATLQRDFTIAVSLKSLVCLLNSPICSNISAEAMAELLEEIAEARTAEAARDLVEAAEELSGVAEEACEHGGRGIPQACADRLFDQALAIITQRWGQTPEKDLTEECRQHSRHSHGQGPGRRHP